MLCQHNRRAERRSQDRGHAGTQRPRRVSIENRHEVSRCGVMLLEIHHRSGARYFSGVVSGLPFSASSSASSFAGFVVLALADTAWSSPGVSMNIWPALYVFSG